MDAILSKRQLTNASKKAGLRFGNYVIQQEGHKGRLRGDGRVDLLYKVKCDCNRHFTWVSLSSLRNGKQNRCDLCGKEKRFGLSINDDILLRYNYIHNAKRNAEKRGLSFQVDREYLWSLFLKQKMKCAISGVKLDIDSSWPRGAIQTASLDRIDSKKGYIKGNVQWIHKDINQMKMNFSQQEFINWCKLITKFKNK